MPKRKFYVPDEHLVCGPTHGNDPYFEYLCDIIKGEYYHELLWALDQMPFESPIDMDENCIKYAIELRNRYMRRGYSGVRTLNQEPSVFEVMVGLSCKCEEEVMADPAKGDRTPDWFHEMLYNLGLSHYSDRVFGTSEKSAVEIAIDNWLSRNISKNGKGSAFPLEARDRKKDCRKVGLWTSMMWYMAENHVLDLYEE